MLLNDHKILWYLACNTDRIIGRGLNSVYIGSPRSFKTLFAILFILLYFLLIKIVIINWFCYIICSKYWKCFSQLYLCWGSYIRFFFYYWQIWTVKPLYKLLKSSNFTTMQNVCPKHWTMFHLFTHAVGQGGLLGMRFAW